MVVEKIADELSRIQTDSSGLENPFMAIELEEPEYDRLYSLIIHHKTLNQADNFCRFAGNRFNNSWIRKEIPQDYAQQYSKIFYKELREVIATLDDLDVPYMVLRGVALQPLYPLENLRYMSDFEIYFETIEAANRAIQAFQKFEFFPSAEAVQFISRQYETNSNKYQIKISLEDIYEHRRFPIDLKIGCVGSIDIDIMIRAMTLQFKDIKLKVPCIEDSLLLLADHIIEHTYYRNRDFNDVYILLNNRKLDWDYLIETAHHNTLGEVILALIEKTEHFYQRKLIREEWRKNLLRRRSLYKSMESFFNDPVEHIWRSLYQYTCQEWLHSKNKPLWKRILSLIDQVNISLAILATNSENKETRHESSLKYRIANKMISKYRKRFKDMTIQERDHIFLLPIQLQYEDHIVLFNHVDVLKAHAVITEKNNIFALLFADKQLLLIKMDDFEIVLSASGFYLPECDISLSNDNLYKAQQMCLELLDPLIIDDAVSIELREVKTI